ncbi:MAG: DUF2141 domain-containing protein [Spirochaetia bacterium]|jgi:uncharacterized protein (DUF2141 family)|nr:DUF2141 domain-containing protein [Spirochaetia bacterium]
MRLWQGSGLLAVLMSSLAVGILGAQEVDIRLIVKGLKGEGKLYVAVYDSQEGFKSENAHTGLILDPDGEVVETILRLPEGYYVVSMFQDINGNGALDKGFLGIPKEPIGLSRFEKMGIPGGFDKHKVWLGAASNTITITLIAL